MTWFSFYLEISTLTLNIRTPKRNLIFKLLKLLNYYSKLFHPTCLANQKKQHLKLNFVENPKKLQFFFLQNIPQNGKLLCPA